MTSLVCPECGGRWLAGVTCQDYFHQMLYWESESPVNGEVHHLTVLCCYLQHPSLYSPQGLEDAIGLLKVFIETGEDPGKVRQRNRARLDSSRRRWKIKGTAASHGAYPKTLQWTMTANFVISAGEQNYRESVRQWAHSIYTSLLQAGLVENDN